MTVDIIQASSAKAGYQASPTRTDARARVSATIDTANGGLYFWHVTSNYIYGCVCALFSTNGIPLGSVITRVRVGIYPSFRSFNSGTPTLYVLKRNDYSKPSSPIVEDDFQIVYPQTKLTSGIDMAGMSLSAWNWADIDVVAIKKAGVTGLYFLMSLDWDDGALGEGTDNEFFFINPPDPPTYPKLEITYTLPPNCVYGGGNRSVILR